MRVAFTSSDGRTIDEHFGQARDFWLWELRPGAPAEGLGKVSALGGGDDEEDRIAARAGAVAGCAIVCTLAIGGPAAARLVARRIHPMKLGVPSPIPDVLAKLQAVLEGNPPPWLRKAIAGTSPE